MANLRQPSAYSCSPPTPRLIRAMIIASQQHIDKAEALLVMMKAEWPEVLKVNNTPEQRRVLASYLLNHEYFTMCHYYGLRFMEALCIMCERREDYERCGRIVAAIAQVHELCNPPAA